MSEALVFLAAPAALAFLMVGIHAYLGLHVLERDVVFVDIGLSQVAALGAALGSLTTGADDGPGSLALSLGLCLVVAGILALLRKFERKISQEALIGMTYALASGLLIITADRMPHGAEHLKQSLIGNILFVTWDQILVVAGVYIFVGLLHWIFRKPFWAVSRGEARSLVWDFLFYSLFSLVITFSTHHAGVLVVFAILVAPAALARRFFDNTSSRLWAAWGFGCVGVFTSFLLSYKWDLPTGAVLVATLTLLFFALLGGALLRESRRSS